MRNYQAKTSTTSQTRDFGEINKSVQVNIEKILVFFDIEYKVYKNRISLVCPFHNSSKNESLTIYTGETPTFKCWTNHCEEEVGKTMIQFLSSLISVKKNNCSIGMAVEWLEGFVGDKFATLTDDIIEKRKFTQLLRDHDKQQKISTLTRDDIRKHLNIPSEYFLNRNYDKKTLDHFDVGVCFKRESDMFMRNVVPVYKNGFYVGSTGRSSNDKCPICSMYHYKHKMCPTNKIEEKWAQKWINSKHFDSGNFLYNIDNLDNNLIIVEGAADVWKLHECGINSAAIFGSTLTDYQAEILKSMYIEKILIGLDNDEAGNSGSDKIYDKLKRYFPMERIELPKKDFGEMTKQEILDVIRRYK